jgi:vitamin B12 transporter
VIVTATVAPTPLDRTTAPVTVISREQIAAQQATSVTELLRQVPGVHIDQAGARGGISSVYVRGSDPNFTVVLIDGVKVNDPTNSRGGSFDFSTLSTDNIERIEIVRGPLSAVYGSDALGGVINIITRRGTGVPNGSVEVSAGRFDAYRTLLQANGTLGVLDYAVSGSYLDNGRPVEGNRFLGATLQTNLGVHLTDAIELRVSCAMLTATVKPSRMTAVVPSSRCSGRRRSVTPKT